MVEGNTGKAISVWLRKPPRLDVIAQRVHELIDIDGLSHRDTAKQLDSKGAVSTLVTFGTATAAGMKCNRSLSPRCRTTTARNAKLDSAKPTTSESRLDEMPRRFSCAILGSLTEEE